MEVAIPRLAVNPNDPRAGVGFGLVVTALVLGTVLLVVLNDRSRVDAPVGASTATVLVLNASGVSQAAAKVADDLRGLGYPIAGTGNAPEQAETTIACRSHVSDAATGLAETIGGARVVEFSARPLEGAASADCIITLGT